MRASGLLVLVFLTLCGCTTMSHHDDIAVSLINVRLGEATVLETTAYFTIRVANASPEPLLLNGSSHKFYLNGLYVGEGLSDETLTVPRLNSGTQQITVHLRNVALATRIKPILESEAVDYRVDSIFYVGEASRVQRWRTAGQGRLALADFQPK